MKKLYDPSIVEDKWYARWMEQKLFNADETSAKPKYSIVIPPPNVTGILHMGHALNCTIQDILVRFKRMNGFEALWVPGADHAGIATQNVVEKKLAKEKKNRHEVGREAFIEEVWEMESAVACHHNRPNKKTRLFLRLEQRALYHGRGAFKSGTQGVRPALP